MSSSERGTTPPVGLAGVLTIRSRVRGVICDSTFSALKEKPDSSRSSMGTGVAPEKAIIDS